MILSMKKRKITLVGVLSLLILCATFLSCRSHSQAETDSAFIRVKQGQFFRGGKPYYFVGTNFWYGAILGSEGCGGDRARLVRELDMMKEKGIDETFAAMKIIKEKYDDKVVFDVVGFFEDEYKESKDKQ